MQEVIDQLALDTTNTILLLAVEKKEILDLLAANKKNVINMAENSNCNKNYSSSVI
jgi:hypothetical protein